ncbi:hypothetical protein [Hafnia sp.]
MWFASTENYRFACQVKQQVVCFLAVAPQQVLNLTRGYGLVNPKEIDNCP